MSDLIDRQAAIDALERILSAGKLAFDTIKAQPAAQPERKTGQWLPIPDSYSFFYTIPICSECGCTTLMRTKTPFCPNCGARMEEDNGRPD